MPINVPDKLPAIEVLKEEKIFVIQQSTALRQDIRAMRIALLNIMPVKQTTETHILRLLSNTPLQIEVDLVYPKTHQSKNTPVEHLRAFYRTFDEISKNKYDGMIITGAPVELLNFEEVDYWNEMKTIMDWTVNNVTSTLFICWAAQAGLYHFFNIPKYPLEEKMFGVFNHKVKDRKLPLVRGFDDTFLAPHARHTEIKLADVEKIKELDVVSDSDEAGVYIVARKDGRQIFITGHSEYDPNTLKEEYERDIEKGMKISIPKNYFLNDEISSTPIVRWRSHANLLFTNWLNYYVYQMTPYNINDIH